MKPGDPIEPGMIITTCDADGVWKVRTMWRRVDASDYADLIGVSLSGPVEAMTDLVAKYNARTKELAERPKPVNLPRHQSWGGKDAARST